MRDAFAAVGDASHALWPFDGSSKVTQLEKQNAQLQAELDAANGKLAQTADVERQRDTLVSLFNLKTPDNLPTVLAPVTAIETANFDATIELGKGTADGIHVGMPVMTGRGLIGRVVQTSDARSSVLLITDGTSNVGVRFAITGDVGVAVGQGNDTTLRVDLIDLASKISPGEVAVTSGLQHSLYPPGLPVGTVKSSVATGQDLRRTVVLDVGADLARLDTVAVVQWKPT